MEKFKIEGDYIQLNQLLKAMDWVENGGEANSIIDQGYVKVNDVVELRKRNKLYPGMKVTMDGKSVELY